ncbi:hypothetical protein Cgig2_016560 [Carnegiea gigantea]|uniref:Uncharacterized protein n=1 Tax=Carnegiea gigantea TaxID=171969 RepID=A0A9Q1QRZ7_9CARY|nr:hypothetical protein Cgig2_016560 [Carnegiea gigantea]
MTFLCSLSTKAMAEYVVRHFEWERTFKPYARAISWLWPRKLLSTSNSQSCPSREAGGLAWASALNTRVSPHRTSWSTFESWVWLYGDRIFEIRFQTKAEPKESSGAGQQEEDSETERRVRAQPLRGQSPLLTITSRGIHPSGRSGITGEERR